MHYPLFCHLSLLRLALPNFITTLSVPLLSVVDIALAGHMDRIEDLASLAIATVLFQLIYWLFGFLRMGTTGTTAQSQSDGVISHQSIKILLNSGLLAIFISLILICFQNPLFNLYYFLVSAEPLTTNLAYSYSSIRILAAPATLLNFVIHGWYLGVQNAWTPLLLTVFIQIINIGLNFLFVSILSMGVDGLALATLLAQWIGLIAAIIHLSNRYKIQKLFLKPTFREVSSILKNNTDLMIRTALLMLSLHSITWLATRFGTDQLAASALVLQLMGLLSYGLDGIAVSCESLVGQAVGQNDRIKLWQIIKTGFLWGFILSLIFSLIFLFGLKSLLTLFTDKQHLIALCLEWKVYVILSPVICFWCYIWDGVFIGAMRTEAMRNTMFFSSIICYLPSIVILMPLYEMHGLWSAYLIFMLARGLSLTLIAKREMNRSINCSDMSYQEISS